MEKEDFYTMLKILNNLILTSTNDEAKAQGKMLYTFLDNYIEQTFYEFDEEVEE
jgi:hypothetical protein